MGEDPQFNHIANLWMDAWKKVSQGVLDVGENMNPSQFQAAVDSPWQSEVAQLRKEFEEGGKLDALRLVEKMVEQGASWSEWADETVAGLEAAREKLDDSENGLNGWKDYLDRIQSANPDSAHWQQQVQSLREIHPQLFQGVDVDWSRLDTDSLLKLVDSNPLLDSGNREQIRETIKLWIEYDSQRQCHAKSLHQIGVDSLKRLGEHLQENPESDVDSLKSLFDLWVKFSEETYAERVSSETYSKSYADMVNAGARLKRHWLQQAGQSLSKFGVPESDEIRELYKRHQDLKRQHRSLQKEFRAYKESNQDQLDTLKGEIHELRQNLTPATAKKTVRKKSTKSANPAKEKK